jgi:hypothetical protein
MTWLLFMALPSLCVGQPVSIRIGSIDFFGTAGVDVAHLRTALPVHPGDTFAEAKLANAKKQVSSVVTTITGAPPTDFSAVCCDAGGGWMIYIGLRGKNSHEIHHLQSPTGSECLPKSAVSLYNDTMSELLPAIRANEAGEDDSRGYSLARYPPLRQSQLALRTYAVDHSQLIEHVVRNCHNAENRAAAADLLGYANQSKRQINALVRASNDSDSTVRNNAIRALWVLASSSKKAAAMIPARHFVALLNSGKWDDRNKAGLLLAALARNGDARLLSELRSRALDSLVEMARWQNPGHADPYRFLLGKIAGLSESRIKNLIASGDVGDLISAAEKTVPSKSR